MKKIAILLFSIALCISLCACKSKAATNADNLILEIGNVTLASKDKIKAANDAVQKLNPKEYEQLEQLALLEDAQSTYKRLLLYKEIETEYQNGNWDNVIENADIYLNTYDENSEESDQVQQWQANARSYQFEPIQIKDYAEIPGVLDFGAFAGIEATEKGIWDFGRITPIELSQIESDGQRKPIKITYKDVDCSIIMSYIRMEKENGYKDTTPYFDLFLSLLQNYELENERYTIDLKITGKDTVRNLPVTFFSIVITEKVLEPTTTNNDVPPTSTVSNNLYEDVKTIDINGKQIWQVYAKSSELHFTGSFHGSGYFGIKILDSNQDFFALVANEIGDYNVDKSVYGLIPDEMYYIQIECTEGSWTCSWTGTYGR